MDIKNDISLKYIGWDKERVDQLVYDPSRPSQTAFFGRTVDLFIVACAIGILEDKRIPNDGQKEYNSIGRNTYQINEDVSRIFHFLFENAILTTKTVDFDSDTRMKLAFDSNFNLEKFSPNTFLVEFSNYGVDKIWEQRTAHDIETITNIMELLKNLVDPEFEKLKNEIFKTLEEIEIKEEF